MPTKIVVSAAIVDRKMKRMLLARRCAETSYPLHWCTVGGSVEECETIADVLKREVKEALRIVLHFMMGVGEFPNLIYVYDIESTKNPGQFFRVMCFLISSDNIDGDPACGDNTIGVCWFDAEELRTLKLAAADDANRGALIRSIESL